MTTLQLFNFSSFYSRCSFPIKFSSGKRIIGLSNTKTLDRRLRLCCQVPESDDQNSGEELSASLFMKELRRRGITPTSLLEERDRIIHEAETTESVDQDIEIHMSSNSQDLEGLIPLTKLWLTTGGTFFLRFWPLIYATIAFFSALYLYYGPAFIHNESKTSSTQPEYTDSSPLVEEKKICQIAPPLN